jgi:hypothetical protein
MGTKDYSLRVAKLDLNDRQEREANILLNNREAQGDYDVEQLEKLLRDVDVEAAGFDAADIYQMFGEDTTQDLGLGQELRDSLNEHAENVRKMVESAAIRDSPDFFFVCVFRSESERLAFCERFGLDDNKYQSGARLTQILEGNSPQSS